ncbi:hypothetical protein N7466_009697 [Penicillium verhagenii]|uniref:uncharacterized protein n=1 Tax=Penicillium verhagenii TaxID=1562060 RepID=UPI002544ECF0|nr:uncharacterized protein N7466_009697 [Penicillium verhagenii]KAJ5921371.1 hypothetical protein N7466_009697 [Penicillium verhagenii]
MSEGDVEEVYEQLEQDFASKERKLARLDDIFKREKILSQQLELCESLVSFCQEQALNTESEEEDKVWMQRVDEWSKKQRNVEEELDDVNDEMGDEPPLPDRELKNGEWTDIDY